MANSTRVTTRWRDRYGRGIRSTKFLSNGVVTPDDAAIIAALGLEQAISTAVPERVTISIESGITGTPAGGAYSNADRALLGMTYADGSASNHELPSPLEAIFQSAKKYLVDPTNALVIAVVAAITTYAVASDGATGYDGTMNGKRLELGHNLKSH
jgi:hypothetical protein